MENCLHTCLHKKFDVDAIIREWFNESMTKGRMLTHADANFLKKVIAPEIEKKVTSNVKKLLIAQDIRNWAKMEELEEKFESKVTEVKSDFFINQILTT